MASARLRLRLRLAAALLLLVLPPSAAAEASKVRLALYYETLCPYCSRFIVNHLAKIFDSGILSVVDLDLVPYGNAHVLSNGTISCQHGPYECLLNTVEACAISAWPDLNVHFRFIYCVESLVVEHKYHEWESCFSETGLDPQPVKDCYENGYGEKLELQYAAQTESLQPPHKFVPWVLVDGQPLYDDYENYEAYICKAYKGDLPKSCESKAIEINLETEASENVCRDNETNLATGTENGQMMIKMVV